MKSKIKYYIAGSLLLGGMLFSCQDFDDMNVNKHSASPETIDPDYLLPAPIIQGTFDMHLYQRIHDLYVDCFSQYFANDKYDTNNCVPVNSYSQNYWDAHWRWIDALNIIVRTTQDKPERTNITQIARIWRVWLFHRATDMWGDIPYSKASNASGIPAAYDTQKDIYYDMLKELDEASRLLDSGLQNPGKSDLIFNGDVEKWRMFAQTMRLRLAMRLSEVDPQKAKTEAEAAVASGKLLTSSVTLLRSDRYQMGADFQYGNTYLHNGGRLTMSKSMEKLLTGLGGIPFPAGSYTTVPAFVDPRGPVYFNVTSKDNKADATYYGRWTGVPAGLSRIDRELPDNKRTNNARLGVKYITNSSTPGAISYIKEKPMTLMYFAEICFLRAEGAARGWNMGGTAQSFYEAGIQASMTENGITAALVTPYLTSEMPNSYGTTVKFTHTAGTNNTALDKILTQKYLGNFPDNSWEAWADFRRLNKPDLDPFVAPDEGYVVQIGARNWKGSVRRIPYPEQEFIVNKINYNAAVERIGGNTTTTRVWWDAKP